MDVTRSNFRELLPEMLDSIRNCTFLAIDCEMTGLNTCNEVNGYDTQNLYYEKMLRAMKNFLVIQYGICAFRYDKEEDTFKQSAYNCYIFRRPINKNVPDTRFMCQSSSIDFLSTQNFDFNKLFKEGISYLNINEEDKYMQYLKDLEKLKTSQQQDDSTNHIAISAEDQPFIDDIIKKIEEFLESESNEMYLPKCNAFLRRLIYQTAHLQFVNKVSLQTKQLENKDRVILVTKFKSEEELEKEAQKKAIEAKEEMEEAIGFSTIIKEIANSGKLVIGHNMFLDLLHTVDKFLTPLPKDYEEFKECVSSLLTKVLDTKYMSNLAPFKELIPSNVLPHLLETVTKEPFTLPEVEIEDNRKGYTLKCNKEHEAGYDAYITGIAFLSMWKYLGDEEKRTKIFTDFSLLKPYINKLYIMKVLDGLHINLGGHDLKPERGHVLHITFPPQWKTNNIIQLFSPFGPVQIAWIDDESAYVGLQKADQLKVAIKTLSQSETYKITTYEKRQAILQQQEQQLKHAKTAKGRAKKHLLEEKDVVPKKRLALSLGELVVVVLMFILFYNNYKIPEHLPPRNLTNLKIGLNHTTISGVLCKGRTEIQRLRRLFKKITAGSSNNI